MATCCRQLCPRITSCSGWPVSGHGERNALSSPLTFRSLYFLFHSAQSWLGRMGVAEEGGGAWMKSLKDRRGGSQAAVQHQHHPHFCSNMNAIMSCINQFYSRINILTDISNITLSEVVCEKITHFVSYHQSSWSAPGSGLRRSILLTLRQPNQHKICCKTNNLLVFLEKKKF